MRHFSHAQACAHPCTHRAAAALAVAVLACATAPPLARAQAGADARTDAGARATTIVPVTPAPVCERRRYIAPEDTRPILGAYALSNGDQLRVSRQASRYFAEMGRTGRVELIPLGENDFVEKGGRMHLVFEREWPDADVAISGIDAPRPAGNACRRG